MHVAHFLLHDWLSITFAIPFVFGFGIRIRNTNGSSCLTSLIKTCVYCCVDRVSLCFTVMYHDKVCCTLSTDRWVSTYIHFYVQQPEGHRVPKIPSLCQVVSIDRQLTPKNYQFLYNKLGECKIKHETFSNM